MPSTASKLELCWCGAKAEEDWDYCSRRCGVAEALARLTSTEVSHSPPSVENNFSLAALENADIRATALADLGSDSCHTPHPFDDACSGDGTLSIGEWDLGDNDVFNHQRLELIPRGTHSAYSSLGSTGSPNPRRGSMSDVYYSTPTTSISSADSLWGTARSWDAQTDIATPSSTRRDSRCIHRRPAMPNLRLLEKSAPVGPERPRDGDSQLHRNRDPTRRTSNRSYNFPQAVIEDQERGHADILPAWNDPLSGEDGVEGYPDDEGRSGNPAKVSQDEICGTDQTGAHGKEGILEYPTHKSAMHKVPCDSLEYQSSNPSSTTKPPPTKLFQTLKKASNRVLAKLSMPSAKRPRLIVKIGSEGQSPSSTFSQTCDITSDLTHNVAMGEIELSTAVARQDEGHPAGPPKPSDPSVSQSASPSRAAIVARRRQRGRVVGDMRPELATLATPPLAAVDNPKLMDTTPGCDCEEVTTDDNLEIGPGRPLYFEIREAGASEHPRGQEDDDWNHFVTIQRMRERSRKHSEQDCWDVPVW